MHILLPHTRVIYLSKDHISPTKRAEWKTNLVGILTSPSVYSNFHRVLTLAKTFGIPCSKKMEWNTGECPALSGKFTAIQLHEFWNTEGKTFRQCEIPMKSGADRKCCWNSSKFDIQMEYGMEGHEK
ncbi:hypothetical protein AVEN_52961-1 [Araneus ventricosus]|uniref:Uncharacterized protein n=1 Tax=Araneus ventricosus TaxID=182803 RepID=A0A4Y2JN50_ARAVE|nr:hypothetical protein AVEN_52961-1 [Araneus ventricosus]